MSYIKYDIFLYKNRINYVIIEIVKDKKFLLIILNKKEN